MAAVVRIKRRLNQEPAEALLLASKSKKFKADGPQNEDDPSSEPNETGQNIFKFCGTIDIQEKDLDAIAQLVEKGQKTSHRAKARRRTSSFVAAKEDLPHQFQEKRYKLLNHLRKVDDSVCDFRVFDLVCEEELPKFGGQEVVECNGIPLTVEKVQAAEEDTYVYDVYYADTGAFDESYIDQLLSVQPFSYDSNYEDSDGPEDDEDSNDENNYRNDYPDTEDEEDQWSNEDVDLATGMTRMNLKESDLSSEDDDFIYAKDYGDHYDDKESPAYAAFKKRIAQEIEDEDDVHSD